MNVGWYTAVHSAQVVRARWLCTLELPTCLHCSMYVVLAALLQHHVCAMDTPICQPHGETRRLTHSILKHVCTSSMMPA